MQYDARIFLIFGAIALLLLFGMHPRFINRNKGSNIPPGPNLGDAVLPLLGFIFFGLFFLIDLVQSLRRGTPTTMENFWGADRFVSLVIETIIPGTAGVVFLALFVRSVLRVLRRPRPSAPASS